MKHSIRARVSEFWDLEKNEIVYGVALQMGYRLKYCKCVIGHLQYKTKEEAEKARKKIQNKLNNLDKDTMDYLMSLSKGKYEYISI